MLAGAGSCAAADTDTNGVPCLPVDPMRGALLMGGVQSLPVMGRVAHEPPYNLLSSPSTYGGVSVDRLAAMQYPVSPSQQVQRGDMGPVDTPPWPYGCDTGASSGLVGQHGYAMGVVPNAGPNMQVPLAKFQYPGFFSRDADGFPD